MPGPDPVSEPIDGEIVDSPSAPADVPADPLAAGPPPADYDEHGVPSFDYVRAKIEGRAATGVGTAELAGGTVAARTIEQQEADRAAAAKAKLEEIRRSLG